MRRKKSTNPLIKPVDPYVLYYAWKRAGKKKSTENKTPRKKSTKPRALTTPKSK